MKTTQKTDKLVEISTDAAHILHRIGSDEYGVIRRITTASPGEWEEIAVSDIPPYSNAEYKARVSALVHKRYSIDDEIALAANAACPALLADEERAAAFADEYAAYQTYRAECKARARAELEARDTETSTA